MQKQLREGKHHGKGEAFVKSNIVMSYDMTHLAQRTRFCQ